MQTFKELRGFTIQATDGDIGKIHDLFFDDLWWIVRYLVVDTGKWLPGRKVLISPRSVGKPQPDAHALPVGLTREMVEKSPAIDASRPLSREFETELVHYYGWPLYWSGTSVTSPGMLGAHPGSLAAVAEAARVEAGAAESDVGLRSAADVSDYHIQAKDGDIGHVEDLMIDETSWAIRYLLVNTRNWLPGRKVLVAPSWVEKVSWGESSVYVDLSREEVRHSPPYEPAVAVDRDYESRLYDHYRRPRYWS